MIRVSEDVLTAHLEGEAVVLHLETKNYYRLNATAARIWKALEKGATKGELLTVLADEYDAEPDVAEAGLDRILGDLAERSLLARDDG